MPEVISQTATPTTAPALPQPTHTSITFCKTQKRYAQRPINHFPWKSFHLRMTSQGYVVGSDWAMTTFDDRTDDQFFDSKRLQTIEEGNEVRFFYPFDPLGYSRDCADFDILEEVRYINLHQRESFGRRLFVGAKHVLAQVVLKAFSYSIPKKRLRLGYEPFSVLEFLV